ncbi:hypothetical protein ACFLYF_00330 [Chloroflexota bacterium]
MWLSDITHMPTNIDITGYIEIFYYRQRRQAKLWFLLPVTCEQRFYTGLLATWKVWYSLLTSDLKQKALIREYSAITTLDC